MSALRRINVSSGRPLEARAYYSRALRVGNSVLQSGTTSIDREGNVLGEDDVATQVRVILELARQSMGAAEGNFRDVVRARLHLTGSAEESRAVATLLAGLDGARPVLTVVPVSRLARPSQLVEIELEAIDDASQRATRLGDGPAAETLRMGDRVFVGGRSDGSGLMPEVQVEKTLAAIGEQLANAGAALEDWVCARAFVTEPLSFKGYRDAAREALHGVRPAGSIFGVSSLGGAAVRIEGEAVIGAGSRRTDYGGSDLLPFSRCVRAFDRIFVAASGSVDTDNAIPVGDWGGQRDRCTEALERQLVEAGASLDDVVVRRYFTRADADMNRGYGDGPSWFKGTRPVALGCRVSHHADPAILISLEAEARVGAAQHIEWREIAV